MSSDSLDEDSPEDWEASTTPLRVPLAVEAAPATNAVTTPGANAAAEAESALPVPT